MAKCVTYVSEQVLPMSQVHTRGGGRRYCGVTTILTLNTFLHDIRLFGRVPVYPPAPFVAERLAALPAAIADVDADVVCLQEVFRRSHRDTLADRLQSIYPHVAGRHHPGPSLGTGLMVLSRHPVVAVRPLEFKAALMVERLVIRKGLLECTIDPPDLGPCRFINAHLVACGLGKDPEGARGESCRSRRSDELLAGVDATAAPMTIVAGDLNCGPHTSADNYRQILAGGFVDLYAESAVEDAISWDPENPLVKGKDSDLPGQRIDHILLGGDAIDRCRPEIAHASSSTSAASIRGPRGGCRFPTTMAF